MNRKILRIAIFSALMMTSISVVAQNAGQKAKEQYEGSHSAYGNTEMGKESKNRVLMKSNYFTDDTFLSDETYTKANIFQKGSSEHNAAIEAIKSDIDLFARVYHRAYGFSILDWEQKSYPQKISELKSFVIELENQSNQNLQAAQFPADSGVINRELYKPLDEFAAKTKGLEGITTTREYNGEGSIKNATITTTEYTAPNGEKYTKVIEDWGNYNIINLHEKNQPLFNYSSIQPIDSQDGGGYRVFTGEGRTQSGTLPPNGYSVATDNSNPKEPRLVMVPDNEALLPEGVKVKVVKDDITEGTRKIVEAPASAYKENGNLALLPDPTLQKTTVVRKAKQFNNNEYTQTASVTVSTTQEGNTYYDGLREKDWGEDLQFYSYSMVDEHGRSTDFTRSNAECNGQTYEKVHERGSGHKYPQWVIDAGCEK